MMLPKITPAVIGAMIAAVLAMPVASAGAAEIYRPLATSKTGANTYRIDLAASFSFDPALAVYADLDTLTQHVGAAACALKLSTDGAPPAGFFAGGRPTQPGVPVRKIPGLRALDTGAADVPDARRAPRGRLGLYFQNATKYPGKRMKNAVEILLRWEPGRYVVPVGERVCYYGLHRFTNAE